VYVSSDGRFGMLAADYHATAGVVALLAVAYGLSFPLADSS
jgi:hypothetical protein